MARLDEWLRSAPAHVYGQSDCCLWPAAWVEHVTGRHPAPEMLGAYHDAEGCKRIVETAGGVVAVMQSFALRAGLEPTQTPQRGDIGTVIIPGLTQLGAICTGAKWAVLCPKGVLIRKFEWLGAWRV